MGVIMEIINYSSIATVIGLAKLRNAAILKQPLNLAVVKFGDSNGVEYTPDGSEVDLKNIVHAGVINASENNDAVETWAEITSVIPIESGPFWVREMGIYDEDGDLIFIAAIAPRYKPPFESTTVDMSFELVVDILNASAVTITIDPYTTLATRAWVNSKFEFVEVKKNSLAEKNRDHIFLNHADLQLTDEDDRSAICVEVDESVDLSSGECRVKAPPGEKITVNGKQVDVARFKETNVRYRFKRINGVWKV